jgi:hypothetical protein
MVLNVLNVTRANYIVYVGEPEGMCTASDTFFRLLSLSWREIAHVAIPSWPGIHDALWVYTRKERF